MFPKKTAGVTVPKTDARGFTGMVGKQSSKVSGKQGRHHHPLMAQLGATLAKGMRPGGFTKTKVTEEY